MDMPIGEVGGASRYAVQALRGSTPGIRDGSAGGARQAVVTFGRLLARAVENLNQVNAQADEAVAQLAAGEPVELHDVMIAMEEADLSLWLALQVRNKLVEAYQEIQRMQV